MHDDLRTDNTGDAAGDGRPDDGLLTPVASDYVPPHITVLGTLGELTLGGTPGFDDGAGMSGDTGSV